MHAHRDMTKRYEPRVTYKEREMTCSRIIDRPEFLFELKVCQQYPDPDPCLEPELLLLGVENGASHAGDEKNGVEIGLNRVRAPVPEARAGTQASEHLFDP